MITTTEENKLRGGYYTPSEIAAFLTEWAIQRHTDQVLEPSCGDGVFLETCVQRLTTLGTTVSNVNKQLIGVEIIPQEAEKASAKIRPFGGAITTCVICDDFFNWIKQNSQKSFDCVVGNPPFIRYQNFPESSRSNAISLLRNLGLKPNKLTNIWVPFVAASTSLLNPEGRLAFVLPAELLQVTYAAQLRSFLADQFKRITILTCNDMLFDSAEQEVILLLAEGKVNKPSPYNKCRIDLIENGNLTHLLKRSPHQKVKGKQKIVNHDSEKWLKYFLTSPEISFMRTLRDSEITSTLGEYAEVDVGIVTGRNSFFVLSKNDVDTHGLHKYALPLIGRSSHLRGTLIRNREFINLANNDERVFLLFIQPGSHRTLTQKVKAYIAQGEKLNIHKGYKCSIRKEWYCVPSVWIPHCFIFRQIYDFPRFVVNKARATSTDTIHRVKCSVAPTLFARNVYTHLTAASSEIEGRSYGGGVLELEPNEAEKVLVPSSLSEAGLTLTEIDEMIRRGELIEVLRQNDQKILQAHLGLSNSDCKILERIWVKMRNRRLARGKRKR